MTTAPSHFVTFDKVICEFRRKNQSLRITGNERKKPFSSRVNLRANIPDGLIRRDEVRL
jgi:hypothetical protein